MFDAEVRIEHMLYLPALAASEDSFPDAFDDEFLFDLPERSDAPLWLQCPALLRFAPKSSDDDLEEVDAHEVAYALRMVPGFLFEAATPVRSYLSGSEIYTSGWGYYHTEWLYAATEAAIASVATAWAEAEHERDKAQALTKAVAS